MIVVGELRAWKDLQQRCGHPEPSVCSDETAYLQLWIQHQLHDDVVSARHDQSQDTRDQVVEL